MDPVQEKLNWFMEMTECADGLFLWDYTTSWDIRSSNCPEDKAVYWSHLFRVVGGPEQVSPLFAHSRKPVLFNAAVDLSWIIVPAVEKHTIARYLVLGPVFLSSMSQQELDKALDSYDFATSSKYEYKTHLEDLPSIQYPAFLLYGKMLNRCLYPEVVDLMDFRIVSAKNVRVRPENRLSSEIVLDSSEGRADIEDLLLQQIRQGNPNFRNAIPALQLGQYGEMAPQSTLRQLKDECIVAITLSSRAAMDGGLSRQQARGVGDSYIRQVESADTIEEVMGIYEPMVSDFIRRVHNKHLQQQYSVPIRNCMDYMEQHITEPLTVRSVVEGTGYTGYYISNLFRRETGKSLGEYINERKVEYAKHLLLETGDSVGAISKQLNFSSASHFTAVFRQVTGMTPSAFREAGSAGEQSSP